LSIAAQNSAPKITFDTQHRAEIDPKITSNPRQKKIRALVLSGGLVELTGIEPVTPWLQTRCSPS
jgi:hypothetical protein